MKWLLIAGIFVAIAVAAVVITGTLLPKAHVAKRSARLRRSPDQVWALISGDQSWRPDVRRYERLPDANGHRCWREVDKHGNSITYEAVETDPPRRLVTRIADKNQPFGGSWTYELASDSAGSAIQITERGEVYNPVFRLYRASSWGTPRPSMPT